jgi:hypothetical protein
MVFSASHSKDTNKNPTDKQSLALPQGGMPLRNMHRQWTLTPRIHVCPNTIYGVANCEVVAQTGRPRQDGMDSSLNSTQEMGIDSFAKNWVTGPTSAIACGTDIMTPTPTALVRNFFEHHDVDRTRFLQHSRAYLGPIICRVPSSSRLQISVSLVVC